MTSGLRRLMEGEIPDPDEPSRTVYNRMRLLSMEYISLALTPLR